MGDVNVAVLLQDAWSRQLPMFANSFACKKNRYRNLTDSTNRNFACSNTHSPQYVAGFLTVGISDHLFISGTLLSSTHGHIFSTVSFTLSQCLLLEG